MLTPMRVGGPPSFPVQSHRPTHRLGNCVHRRHLAIRARLAEAAEGPVDEPGVFLAQSVVSYAEPVHRPRAEILGDDVRFVREPLHEILAFGRLQVDADPALAAVRTEEERRDPFVVRPEAALLLVVLRVLDLHDLRAQVGQLHRPERSGKRPREVEHTNAIKGTVHHRSLAREVGVLIVLTS